MPLKAQTGTIVVITSPDGHVQAVKGDLRCGRPAGFSVAHMQASRATDEAWPAVVPKHCIGAMARAIIGAGNGMTVRSLAHCRVENGWGVTVKTLEIGENDAETAESGSE